MSKHCSQTFALLVSLLIIALVALLVITLQFLWQASYNTLPCLINSYIELIHVISLYEWHFV